MFVVGSVDLSVSTGMGILVKSSKGLVLNFPMPPSELALRII